MISRLCASLLFLLVLAGAAPRPAAALDLGWGFRAGWSAARLHGDFGDELGGGYLGNFATAVYARLPLTARLGFQPEIGFSTKGGEGDVEVGSANDPPETRYRYHVENRMSYLEIPLLARLEIPVARGVQPYLLAGPAPAWRLGDGKTNAKLVAPAARAARPAAVIFEDIGTLDGTIRTRSFDLGAVGGLGVWFGGGNTRVGFEARYVWGLLDVHPSENAEVRNGMFAITAAIEVR